MKYYSFLLLSTLLILGCKESPRIVKEQWMDEPVGEWPDFALTNEISFKDKTYYDIANSFLIDTGKDTIGVSCKHLFMVFEDQLGQKRIDLGDDLNYWRMYPKDDKEKKVTVKRLINADPNEKIGEFNTLKVRDWILFELKDQNHQLYPLKIRHEPVKNNELLYAVGWGQKQKDDTKPALIKLRCIDNLGDYYYVKPLKTNTHPAGRSGSPVIDKNGYLVGIVSGQEGNLGVIGGMKYLKTLLDQYDIDHEKPDH